MTKINLLNKSTYSKLIPLFLVCFFVFIPVFTNAQTAEELQSNLNSLNSQIDALDREIKEFNSKIDKTQGEAKTLNSALSSLQLRRNLLAKEIQKAELNIEKAEDAIVDTEYKLSDTEVVLGKNKESLARALRNIAQDDSPMPPIIMAIGSTSSLSDAIDIIDRQKQLSRAIDEKVHELASTKNTLADQKKTYEIHKQSLVELTSTLSDKKVLVEVTAKDTNNLLVQTKNKESEYQKLLADRKKKKGELEKEMLDVESKLSVIVDSTKLPENGKVLQYPVGDVKITQYFGNTPFASKNPQVYNGAGHNGIDFGVRSGSPIYSAASGVVVGTGDTDAACNGVSYGKWVLIKHNNGLSTLYAHLSVIQVTAGKQVAGKEKIGLSGNTGYSTGPHLHFTVYASDSVHITGPREYRSKVCGTYLIMPIAPRDGYLNPLSYL